MNDETSQGQFLREYKLVVVGGGGEQCGDGYFADLARVNPTFLLCS